MLSESVIRELLTEGESISLGDYIAHCRINASKTFYYFCRALVQQGESNWLSSSELKAYIFSQIAGVYPHSDNFHPQQWFGADWTGRLRGGKMFRDEYIEILERSPERPYSYRIKAKYFEIVKDILYINDPLEEIQRYQSSYADLQETEREAVIQSRVGQGKFRADLIQYWGECAVTGCKCLSVLRASHIKPWRESSNEERLDKYNGLLLVPNLDVVFDAGYISFADDGRIIISDSLTEDDLLGLGIHSELSIDSSRLTEQHLEYLHYHRRYIFG